MIWKYQYKRGGGGGGGGGGRHNIRLYGSEEYQYS